MVIDVASISSILIGPVGGPGLSMKAKDIQEIIFFYFKSKLGDRTSTVFLYPYHSPYQE
jgi:hypothetical protein